MDSLSREIPDETPSDTDNCSVTSYDMAEDTAPPTTASASKYKNNATRPDKVNSLEFEDVITGPAVESLITHDNKKSFLPSWISNFPGIARAHASDVTEAGRSVERTWLQSALQTTGESDVESVISNDSSLGELETRASESFTDLKLDADLQAIRNDIQTETDGLFRILDDIHLGNETTVPRGTSVELRKRARAIVSIFGDNVSSLKCTIKAQREEMGRLAAELIASGETICHLKYQKSEEIKILKLGRQSAIQKPNIKQEKERDAAIFELSELLAMVGNFKKEMGDLKKRDDEISQALEHEEKSQHKLAEVIATEQAEKGLVLGARNILAQNIRDLNLTKDTLSRRNEELEQENLALKQKIEDNRAADADKFKTIKEKFEDSTAQLEIMQKAKAVQQQPTVLQGWPITTPKDQFRGGQNHTNDFQNQAARRRAEAISAKNAELSQAKSLIEHSTTCKALKTENATLKDKLCQVSAQFEHAHIGAKCTRDALNERNEELKGANNVKEKANWVLRDTLVTAWTQVETLSKQLKTQTSNSVLTNGPTSDDHPRSQDTEASHPCTKCLTLEFELSTIRDDLYMHQKKQEDSEKMRRRTLAEKEAVKEELKQAVVKIADLQIDAIRARQNYRNLAKNANERNAEHEKILQATKKRLSSTLDETRRLGRQISKSRTELERYMGVTYEKEGDTLHNLTRFFCLMSEQKEENLKRRVEKAEQRAVDEVERHRKSHAMVQKDARDLINRMGGVGSSTDEVLGKWALDEFRESSP
ncbi:hypothetical protein L207DRAFT_637863 [Hyaloscypha variabilis F]|uniref:Uncharacterized protein n=1 Tax=Hyaloscypha variabilis (strain UAMH 11265 / GT02V1 / F) TaxID=1149755 RepID=A0A2J6RAF5_HYAVF|nr:hypothetical protein L207DRAFT_637863 [Hyaloscypha variabilis F]